MALSEMISYAKNLVSQTASGEFASAAKTLGALLSGVGDLLSDIGFRGTADDDAQKQEFQALLSEAAANCSSTRAPVGKLFPGDGTFLKTMIELFLKYAPLFLGPKPPSA